MKLNSRFLHCIHEAGHAIVFDHYDNWIISLKVSDEEFAVKERHAQADEAELALGICETFPPLLPRPLSLCPFDDELFIIDKAETKKFVANQAYSKKFWVGRIRGYVCGLMSGKIAEGIFKEYEDICLEHEHIIYSDLTMAESLIRVLPKPNTAFEELKAETIDLLSRPDIWKRVIALAEALNAAGTMEHKDIKPFLKTRLAPVSC